MEEVGELALFVHHRFGTKPRKPAEDHQGLAEELADVLFVILCMANEQGIDLEEAFERCLRSTALETVTDGRERQKRTEGPGALPGLRGPWRLEPDDPPYGASV